MAVFAKRLSRLFYRVYLLLALAVLTILFVSSSPAGLSATPEDITVDIQTTVPDAPPAALVYNPVALDESDIQALAGKFGLSGATVETDTPEVKRLAVGSRKLIAEKKNGIYTYADFSLFASTRTHSMTTDTAADAVNTFLTDNDLLRPGDALLGAEVARHEYSPGLMEPTEFVFLYGPALYSGDSTLPVFGPGGRLFVDIGDGAEITLVMQNMPEVATAGARSTISGADAVAKLVGEPQNLVQVPVTLPAVVTVDTVTVSYYAAVGDRPHRIEPVYIFSGTISDGETSGSFLQVVPALADTQIPELMDVYPLYGDKGGTAYEDSGRAWVDFAPGDFTGTMTVTVDETGAAFYPPPEGLVSYGPVYDFRSDTGFNSARINLAVFESHDPQEANVFRWTGSEWQIVTNGRSVNALNRTIGVETGSFSLYGAFGAPPSTGVNVNTAAVSALLCLAFGTLLLARRSGVAGGVSILLIVTVVGNLLLAGPALSESTFSTGIERYDLRNGCVRLPRLLHAFRDADSFSMELVNNGYDLTRVNGNAATVGIWKDANNQLFEKKDIAYFNGQSQRGSEGINFTAPDDLGCRLEAEDTEWGSLDLKIVVLHSSWTLMDPRVRSRWSLALFGGLHQLLGFDSERLDSPSTGQRYVRWMDGSLGERTSWEAWILAAYGTQWSFKSSRDVGMWYKENDGSNAFRDGPFGENTFARTDRGAQQNVRRVLHPIPAIPVIIPPKRWPWEERPVLPIPPPPVFP